MRNAAQLLCLVCFTVGCQNRTVTELNGVEITVVGNAVRVDVVDDTATIKNGEREYALAVENGALLVNGRKYGPVAEGDEVTISGEQLEINSQPAQPLVE